MRLTSAFIVLATTCIVFGATSSVASTITAELAKRCGALTAKQFPPREVGNPAAGSAKGAGRAQHDYFNKCVANNGKPDDGTPAAK